MTTHASSNDTVTLAEVHRLLSSTEFASAQDLAPLVDLRDAPPRTEQVQGPVEPDAPALPKRR